MSYSLNSLKEYIGITWTSIIGRIHGDATNLDYIPHEN